MNPNDKKQQQGDRSRQKPGQDQQTPGKEKRQAPGQTPDRDIGDDREPNRRRDQPDAEPQIPAEKPPSGM